MEKKSKRRSKRINKIPTMMIRRRIVKAIVAVEAIPMKRKRLSRVIQKRTRRKHRIKQRILPHHLKSQHPNQQIQHLRNLTIILHLPQLKKVIMMIVVRRKRVAMAKKRNPRHPKKRNQQKFQMNKRLKLMLRKGIVII